MRTPDEVCEEKVSRRPPIWRRPSYRAVQHARALDGFKGIVVIVKPGQAMTRVLGRRWRQLRRLLLGNRLP